jgi:hypothetical protein
VNRRGNAPLRRPVGTTPLRRRVLVFTECLKTEPSYLLAWARHLRARLALDISDLHGTPATIVTHAIKARDSMERRARRDVGDRYDAIWCVFDVDEHPDVDDAIRRADDHEIGVAVSNPCIELWFLLHWAEQSAYLHRGDAQAAVRPHVGASKTITEPVALQLIALHDDAAARAKQLAERHRLNGSTPGSNPSSTVWRLIDDLGVW